MLVRTYGWKLAQFETYLKVNFILRDKISSIYNSSTREGKGIEKKADIILLVKRPSTKSIIALICPN